MSAVAAFSKSRGCTNSSLNQGYVSPEKAEASQASARFTSGLAIWAKLDADAGALGVHDAAAPKGRPPGTTELAFATDERLEDLAARLSEAGYAPDLHDEDFGRSLRLTDPDGVTIQIQEIDIQKSKQSAIALAAGR